MTENRRLTEFTAEPAAEEERNEAGEGDGNRNGDNGDEREEAASADTAPEDLRSAVVDGEAEDPGGTGDDAAVPTNEGREPSVVACEPAGGSGADAGPAAESDLRIRDSPDGDDELRPGRETDSDSDTDADTDAESASPPDDDVAPPMGTYVFDTDGASCGECGATVERRWRDGDQLTCADCKDW